MGRLPSRSETWKEKLLTSTVRSAFFISLCGLLLGGQNTPLFRSDAEFVTVDVQVLLGNRPVLDLKPSDFVLHDDGQRQTISVFVTENRPLDIILLLDVSASTEQIQQMMKAYALEAFSHLDANDRVGVVTFNTHPQVVATPTSDRIDLARKISRIDGAQGGTELNAILLNTSIILTQIARPSARRAIIVLTDNCAERDVPDDAVRRELHESGITVNALLFPAPCSGRDADVRRFASATGGDVLDVDEQLPLAEMFRRMRQRYLLLYRAPGGTPGSFRKVRVELSRDSRARLKNATVRAREGYVVSAPLETRDRVDARIRQ
jgi:VWFA-related protein